MGCRRALPAARGRHDHLFVASAAPQPQSRCGSSEGPLLHDAAQLLTASTQASVPRQPLLDGTATGWLAGALGEAVNPTQGGLQETDPQPAQRLGFPAARPM